MSTQIRAQIRVIDGVNDAAEYARVSAFVQRGLENAAKQVSRSSMAFDPVTGEPLYNVPYADLGARSLIEHIQITSPKALMGVLKTDYTGMEDIVSHVEPILVLPNYDDEDEDG